MKTKSNHDSPLTRQVFKMIFYTQTKKVKNTEVWFPPGNLNRCYQSFGKCNAFWSIA